MQNSPKRTPCPCCTYLTMWEDSPCSFDICPVCGWEDDLLQSKDPSLRGGANALSLDEARKNFQLTGMADPNFTKVRPPKAEEIP